MVGELEIGKQLGSVYGKQALYRFYLNHNQVLNQEVQPSFVPFVPSWWIISKPCLAPTPSTNQPSDKLPASTPADTSPKPDVAYR